MSTARQPNRTQKLDLRLSPADKQIIDTAANAVNSSVSEFVLKCVLARAKEVLSERNYFGLDAKQWKAFQAALDAPVRNLPRIKRLLSEDSIFDLPLNKKTKRKTKK